MLADPFVGERLIDDEISLLVVEGHVTSDLPSPGSLAVVVAHAGGRLGDDGPDGVDLVADRSHLDRLLAAVRTNPLAATSLAVLLRQTERLPVELGLAAESAVYSMLQAGPEYVRWRGASEAAAGNDPEPVVTITRDEARLRITLDRPHRHNAITRQLRDELCTALRLALADDSIATVLLTGRGPSFCSGGDLAEFGLRSDPATAHRVRLAQSPARLLHALGERASVHIHGSAFGGGIELAAFAPLVVADPATQIRLPEVELGLCPGAGGTVSITRRIGRQRTAALALATHAIDAPTALSWGLVDAIEPIVDDSSSRVSLPVERANEPRHQLG